MNKTNYLKVFLLIVLVALTALAGLLAGDYFFSKERFPVNTYIENVDVSRLTLDEAVDSLAQYPIDQAARGSATLYYSVVSFEGVYRFRPADLGFSVNVENSVRAAFNATHKSNFLRSFAQHFSKDRLEIPLVFSVDEKKLKHVLRALTLEVDSVSQDAKVELYGKGAYHIIPEVYGKALDIPASLQSIKDSLAQAPVAKRYSEKQRSFFERKMPLVVKLIAPRINESSLREFPPVYQLSRYQTFYGGHDSKNRIHNIQTIAGWVDGTILLSDESFSLLQLIGPFTEERGFKEAFVIVGDELVPELGGGTCQIATTLFNTVLLADLDVIERHNHSLWFNIYPVGRDATVYQPAPDLKFKNNTGHPIMISATATTHSLVFQIFGTPTSKEVEISSPIISYYSSEEGRQITGWRLPGPNRPYSTKVTVVSKKNGELLRKFVLSSFYQMEGDKGVVKILRPEPKD